jgi:xanthine/uracil/vitamin C permease (AzgA family)
VTAGGFFISLFLTPLIASIPPYATGPALILVGAMMMENLCVLCSSCAGACSVCVL